MATDRGQEIQLEAARYRLATWAPGRDGEAFRRWAADPSIMQPLNLPVRQLSEERVQAYFASFDNRSRFLFATVERASGRPVGFWNAQVHPVHRTCSLHLAIGEKAHWGRGVTQEAGIVLIDWLFDERAVEKIALSVPETNRRMRNLCRQLGWPQEGLLRGELKAAGGEGRIDEVRYGLLKAEWPGVRRRAAAKLTARSTLAR